MSQDDFIARGNIKRFEQKLKCATDDGERQTLMKLLKEARIRLEAALRQP